MDLRTRKVSDIGFRELPAYRKYLISQGKKYKAFLNGPYLRSKKKTFDKVRRLHTICVVEFKKVIAREKIIKRQLQTALEEIEQGDKELAEFYARRKKQNSFEKIPNFVVRIN